MPGQRQPPRKIAAGKDGGSALPGPATDVQQKAAKNAERDWLLAPLPPGTDMQRTLKFTLAIDPAYFDVRAKVEAALRRLPPRPGQAPQPPLEWHAFILALMILHPATAETEDNKGRLAEARLAKAWQDLPPKVQSRVVERLKVELWPIGLPGAQLLELHRGLRPALSAAFERVARDMRAQVKRGRPRDRSCERALARSLAFAYFELTGGCPSWSGSVDTPYSRLVEEISALPGLEGLVGHGRAAAESWRKEITR